MPGDLDGQRSGVHCQTCDNAEHGSRRMGRTTERAPVYGLLKGRTRSDPLNRQCSRRLQTLGNQRIQQPVSCQLSAGPVVVLLADYTSSVVVEKPRDASYHLKNFFAFT